jgi:hypothetical protein
LLFNGGGFLLGGGGLLLGYSCLLLSGGSLLLGYGCLLLSGGSLLLRSSGLLLGLGRLGRIRSVDRGPYHDGSAAPGAKDRMRFGHKLEVREWHINKE